MLKYLKVDTNTWIEYNTEAKRAIVLVKSELEDQLKFSQSQLNQLGLPPTNEDLLAWAKANHPYKGETQSRELITQQITDLNSKLEAMK